MQILCPSLLLITYSFELHLRPSLVARLDIHFQDLVLHVPLLRPRIERLPLDLHLLMCSSVQLLQRDRQRPLHSRDLGRPIPPPHGIPRIRVLSRPPRTSTAT